MDLSLHFMHLMNEKPDAGPQLRNRNNAPSNLILVWMRYTLVVMGQTP
jgi:hypothetical protein